MSSDTLTKWKWFWAWDDEKEERWLREMSQAGWHLALVQFPGRYEFKAGAPRDFVYRLDFNSRRQDFEHYLQLFRDAGWEHLAEYGSWQYFRIEARPGENPEIFTDNSSKVVKYQRVTLLLVVFLPLFIFGLTSMHRLSSGGPYGGFYFLVNCLYFALFLIFTCAIVRLLWRIRQLKRGQI
jgi:hypothetical protein